MELNDTDLDELVAKSFTNITTYDGMIKALSEVPYAPGMPKPKTRVLDAESLKSLVVSDPAELTFNGSELVQLLERMLHFASINTWLLKQFCDECNQTRTKCQACTNGTKIYIQGPRISVSNLTAGTPDRCKCGERSE